VLLDDVQPSFDVTEVHSIKVNARPEIVFSAMKNVTLGEISAAVRLLLFLRAIPEKMVGRERKTASVERPFFSSLQDNGFLLLGEKEKEEIVFGRMVPAGVGRVWRASSAREVPLSGAAEFLAFDHPDYIRVVANLMVEPNGAHGVIVRTESRCLALSRNALREFMPYWRIIRPGSGLIRRLWLRGIRAHALSAPADKA
jgi:hypothetical protein